jgi:hypothetical protein
VYWSGSHASEVRGMGSYTGELLSFLVVGSMIEGTSTARPCVENAVLVCLQTCAATRS